jgi:membrane fusion protein, multidrug efflux system
MNRFPSIIHSLLLPAVVLACLSGCGSSSAEEEKKASTAAAAPAEIALPVIQPVQGSLSTTVRIPGELIAHQQVDLYAKVNSFVKKLYVDVGSEVTEGQLLATMEAPELNAQLNGAASRLKSQEAVYLASKATYDRLLQTSKTPGTISPNDLDLANAKQQSDLAQLEAAKAAYREVSDTRNYLQVRAPFSGVITTRNVSAGAYVGPSGKGSELPLFTLQEQKKLRLVVSVPEAYVSYLNKSSEVMFTVRSLPNDSFRLKVSRLAGALDTRLRSQRMEMDVVNTNKKLLPGMVAEIVIPLQGGSSTFVVPSSAVLNSTLGVFVIRVQDKKASWIPVTAGRSADGKTEISGALSANDTLVQHATEEVRNQSTVPAVKIQ